MQRIQIYPSAAVRQGLIYGLWSLGWAHQFP
jgi:hypothetical protein